MFVDWHNAALHRPALGVPLIVTIKREWQKHTETLAPVWLMKNPNNGRMEYRTGPGWDECIGPDSVKVLAWDYWPDAYKEGDAFYDGR